ncbi:MAG: DUF370 domain-containing protein [Finegoldia sp.]|nr:DUF370 domain-containing protein [Finegoldia sp.]
MDLLGVGFSNFINLDRLVAIVSPESAPLKRLAQQAKENSMAIDVTFGRKTRSLLIMDTGHVILSCLQAETLQMRLEKNNKDREI